MTVCDGIQIFNVDKGALNEMKKTNNTLECGASSILEALSIFADDLLCKYEDEDEVPYEKLFVALKQIIDSASEREEVRDALMTGLCVESGFEIRKVEKSAPKPKEKGVLVRNKAAITLYAKKHTAREVAKHFGFSTHLAAKQYMRVNKIAFVAGDRGRPSIDLDYVKVSELAKTMRLCELSRAFNCTREQMRYFCIKNQITYITKETKK